MYRGLPLRPSLAHCLLASSLGLAVVVGLSCADNDPEFTEVAPLDELSNPCFKANLLDGLSETDPEELRSVFQCLNLRGGFDGAAGLVDALVTTPTRTNRIAALEIATVVNDIPGEVNIVEAMTSASQLLAEQDEFLLHVVHTLAEWTYGLPWSQVQLAYQGGGGDLLRAEAVESGLVQPLIPVLSTLAGALLDSASLAAMGADLQELAAMDELVETLDTLATLVEANESTLFAPFADDLGAYLQASPGPDGRDTLLVLLLALLTPSDGLGGQVPLLNALEPIDTILDEPITLPDVIETLGELYDSGKLHALPEQLHSLTTIDIDGTGLSSGEETAFEALFALLEEADQPVDCPLFHEESLALFILETIAGWDASTLELLVPLADGLGSTMLPLVGLLCSNPIDPGVPGHIPAITRLAETGALGALVPLLDALYHNGSNHNMLRPVLDTLMAFQKGGAIPALQAHALQELDEPFLGNILEILGAYVAPTSPEASGDIYAVLALMNFAMSPPPGGSYEASTLGLMAEPLRATIATEETRIAAWTQRWAVLLRTEGSETNTFLYKFAPLLHIDPDLDSVEGLGDILGNTEMLETILRVLDAAPVAEAAASSTSGETSREGLLGMVGRFAADGSLEAVLTLLRWATDRMEEIGLTPDSLSGDDQEAGTDDATN